MHNNNEQAVAMTLSIGTGKPMNVNAFSGRRTGLYNKLKGLIKYTAATATDSESTHMHMLNTMTTIGRPYFRLNVEDGLGDIDLGEWKVEKSRREKRKTNATLEKIREKTEAYMEQEVVKKVMMEVASVLVHNRQVRSRDRKRWDLVATGHRYHCVVEKCKEVHRYHRSEIELKEHLWKAHADRGFKEFPETEEEKGLISRTLREGRIVHAD